MFNSFSVANYIQIMQALSLPYLNNGSGNTRQQHSVRININLLWSIIN
jgi:hypothetical protein